MRCWACKPGRMRLWEGGISAVCDVRRRWWDASRAFAPDARVGGGPARSSSVGRLRCWRSADARLADRMEARQCRLGAACESGVWGRMVGGRRMRGAQARKLAKKAAKATKSVAKKAAKAAQKIVAGAKAAKSKAAQKQVAKAKKGVNAAQKKLAKAKQSGSKAAIKKAKAALKKAQKQLKKGQKTVRLGCNARVSAAPWDPGQRLWFALLGVQARPYAAMGGRHLCHMRRATALVGCESSVCADARVGGGPAGSPSVGRCAAGVGRCTAGGTHGSPTASARGRMRVRRMGAEGWRSTHAWCAGWQAR